jgi:hypothetical protein
MRRSMVSVIFPAMNSTMIEICVGRNCELGTWIVRLEVLFDLDQLRRSLLALAGGDFGLPLLRLRGLCL